MLSAKRKLLETQLHWNLDVLRDGIYSKVCDLDAEYALSEEPVPFAARKTLSYRPIRVGEKWSDRVFDCAWFHITGKTDGHPDNCIELDLEGEGCLYDASGTPVRGLTNVSSDFDRLLGVPGKKYVPFSDGTFNAEALDLWIDAGSNDLFGHLHSGTLLACRVVRCDYPRKKLYYDYLFLLDFYTALSEENPQKFALLSALEQAGLLIKKDMPKDAIARAEKILEPELTRRATPDPLLTLYATGHSHLDLAWMWPIRETKRKLARTFSTAVANLARYPDYVYGASQPQQFAWLKEQHPSLYAKVKKLVAEGRIEPQGGMWVEADTNVSGGEALVRQFLYGKKFFREEFNKDVDILWLPDVFGFTGALPQIMKGCGITKMLTIKLSWNRVNDFPYHSFIWQGIDKSEVLAHMPPEGTYNGSGAPHGLLDAQRLYKERGQIDKAVLLYGIGDGGGGPGEEHLEMIARAGVHGLPKVINARAQQFFEAFEKDRDKLAKYSGELYLECHQGTYTSQARNKRYNRKTENALLDAEFLSAVASLRGKAYPAEDLEKIWKEALLYQFHDILPGSSIMRVYDESTARYEEMLASLDGMKAEALTDGGKDLCAVNTTSFARREYVTEGGEWYCADVGPYAAAVLSRAEFISPTATETTLENALIRVTFAADGSICSVFDKRTGRETVRPGANTFYIYNDVGDCWDMHADYYMQTPEKAVLVDSLTETNGPTATRIMRYTFGDSTITQRVTLTDGSPVVRFDTQADWREDRRMLRVGFEPIAFTDEVTCDIQFGSIVRPMTEKNSLEEAQYEICAHKWIDVSQADCGMAILNDCKYGYRAKNGTVSINLLRAQNCPCEGQDRGLHSFSYALYPHSGNAEQCDVRKEGYAFNRPLTVAHTQPFGSFLTSSDERVVIESIKRSESGDAISARLYNDSTVARTVTLTAGFAYGHAAFTDMLEAEQEPFEGTTATFAPFEIRTVLLSLPKKIFGR